jgi:hypothetical protein
MTLVGMFMTFYYTKINSYKCSGSWVFPIKRNMNFEYQPSSTYVFLILHKIYHIKSYSFFEDMSAYKKLWSHIETFNCHDW